MSQVNVTIGGKIYRMACDDGQEEHLTALGQRLVDTIELLRGECYTRLGWLHYRRADDPRAFVRDLRFSYALALAFHLIVLRPYFLDRLVCSGA